MKRFSFSIFLPVLVLAAGVTSCKKDKSDPDPLESMTASVSVSASPSPMAPYTYFSFQTGAEVAGSEANTDSWDFALRFTTFLVNGGVSGPGMGGAQLLDGVFDELLEAPESGYRVDAAGDLAIQDGTWYDYNPVTHSFAPKAGKIFVFRTGKGQYAKMEILSVEPTDDSGTVVTPPTLPTKFRYNVRFVFQPDGSRNF